MQFYPSTRWQVPPTFHAAMKSAPASFRQGAILQFEDADHLPLGKVSQAALKQAVAVALKGGFRNPWPYTWVQVSLGHPETVTVWALSGTKLIAVLHTPANTGVLHTTPDGSWPVYERLPVTTMQGAFPTPLTPYQQRLYRAAKSAGFALRGTDIDDWHGALVQWQPYDDPGIKWVSYFDRGRALHYFCAQVTVGRKVRAAWKCRIKRPIRFLVPSTMALSLRWGIRLRRPERFPDSTKGNSAPKVVDQRS